MTSGGILFKNGLLHLVTPDPLGGGHNIARILPVVPLNPLLNVTLLLKSPDVGGGKCVTLALGSVLSCGVTGKKKSTE